MINLAGNPDCDKTIRRELERCQIEVVESPEPNGHEVNSRLTGNLGSFTFHRAWYYWVAHGELPLEAAKRLYAHPVGKTDVRVDGHCGCPPPEHPWLQYRDADGFTLIHDPDGKQERECREVMERTSSETLRQRLRETLERDRFVPDAMAVAARVFVEAYHVDSELGLWLLAEEIRQLPRAHAAQSPVAHAISKHEDYYDDRPVVTVDSIDTYRDDSGQFIERAERQAHRLLYADAYRFLTVYETCAHVWTAAGTLSYGPTWAQGNQLVLATLPEGS